MNPREYFYSTAKNSSFFHTPTYPSSSTSTSSPFPSPPPLAGPLRRANSRLLRRHFLMYYPLAHIKDEARCRIFSAVLRLSHCLVTRSRLLSSFPPSLPPLLDSLLSTAPPPAALIIYIKPVSPLF